MISDAGEPGFDDDWMWHGHGFRLLLIYVGPIYFMLRGLRDDSVWHPIGAFFCFVLWAGMFAYNMRYIKALGK